MALLILPDGVYVATRSAEVRRGVGLARASKCGRRHRCEASAGPLRARLAAQPGRGEASSQDPRAQGDVTPLRPERAPSREAALPRVSRERLGDVRARARGPKRATDDNELVIGRSDPSDAQGSGANSRGTRRAACDHCLPLGAAVPAGRVPGATSTGRPAPGDHQRQPSARLLADQQSAAMAGELSSGPELVRHGGALRLGRARGVGAGAGRAGRSGVSMRATCRTRGLAREPGAASERARPVRAVEVVGHGACPRGQARAERGLRAKRAHGRLRPAFVSTER